MPIVKNPAKSIFSPFLSIFDHFRDGSILRFARKVRRCTIYPVCIAIKKW
jgi:hypothetical protein